MEDRRGSGHQLDGRPMTHAEITAAIRASLLISPKKCDRQFEASSKGTKA
jgi:hypothetical protein